jgi:hypothetical protein
VQGANAWPLARADKDGAAIQPEGDTPSRSASFLCGPTAQQPERGVAIRRLSTPRPTGRDGRDPTGSVSQSSCTHSSGRFAKVSPIESLGLSQWDSPLSSLKRAYRRKECSKHTSSWSAKSRSLFRSSAPTGANGPADIPPGRRQRPHRPGTPRGRGRSRCVDNPTVRRRARNRSRNRNARAPAKHVHPKKKPPQTLLARGGFLVTPAGL